MELVRAGQYLRTADASPKNPSPWMLDVTDVRKIAAERIAELEAANTELRAIFCSHRSSNPETC